MNAIDAAIVREYVVGVARMTRAEAEGEIRRLTAARDAAWAACGNKSLADDDVIVDHPEHVGTVARMNSLINIVRRTFDLWEYP